MIKLKYKLKEPTTGQEHEHRGEPPMFHGSNVPSVLWVFQWSLNSVYWHLQTLETWMQRPKEQFFVAMFSIHSISGLLLQ